MRGKATSRLRQLIADRAGVIREMSLVVRLMVAEIDGVRACEGLGTSMILRPALVVTALLWAGGCSNLFHANFESDPEGYLPREWPPGPPVGDQIFIPVRAPRVEPYDCG
jgi:hypothetical protein